MVCLKEIKEEVVKELNEEAKKLVEKYQSKYEQFKVSARIEVEICRK